SPTRACARGSRRRCSTCSPTDRPAPPGWAPGLEFHLFEGGPDVKVRHHLLGRDRTLRSAQFSFGALRASCRLELSRLLNSVVGLRRPDESGSWPGQDW